MKCTKQAVRIVIKIVSYKTEIRLCEWIKNKFAVDNTSPEDDEKMVLRNELTGFLVLSTNEIINYLSLQRKC